MLAEKKTKGAQPPGFASYWAIALEHHSATSATALTATPFRILQTMFIAGVALEGAASGPLLDGALHALGGRSRLKTPGCIASAA